MTVEELMHQLFDLMQAGHGNDEVQVYDADCGWGTITGITYSGNAPIQLWSDDMQG